LWPRQPGHAYERRPDVQAPDQQSMSRHRRARSSPRRRAVPRATKTRRRAVPHQSRSSSAARASSFGVRRPRAAISPAFEDLRLGLHQARALHVGGRVAAQQAAASATGLGSTCPVGVPRILERRGASPPPRLARQEPSVGHARPRNDCVPSGADERRSASTSSSCAPPSAPDCSWDSGRGVRTIRFSSVPLAEKALLRAGTLRRAGR
jgi:hypothetical protein